MDLPELDDLIHQPARLGIMTLLYRNRSMAHVGLRDRLDLTDGNLASHGRRLEDAGYVRSRKVLAGRNFQLRYWITEDGDEAFRAYLQALRGVLAASGAEAGVDVRPRSATVEERPEERAGSR